MADTENGTVTLAVMGTKLDILIADVKDLKKKQEEQYVTKEEFTPYKRALQIMGAMLITAVFGGLLALVINGGRS